jgi:hypothetical protein
MIGTLNRMEGIKLKAQLYVEGDPDSMDVILAVDNVMIGKLLERALSNEMTKAIEPKLTKEVRMRSTEGVRFKEVGGQTGAASSGGYDIQDKLTELVEFGKEEEIYRLVQGWNHDKEIEKVAYFLRYNKTGLDERHCGDYHKLDDISKVKALFAIWDGKTGDQKTNWAIWKSLMEDKGSGTEEENTNRKTAERTWEEPPDPNKEDEEEDEGDVITENDTMKVCAYFADLQENENFIDSDANRERIEKFSWMIEKLSLDIRNFNAFIILTRSEADDTILKYKASLGQNNWRMQKKTGYKLDREEG